MSKAALTFLLLLSGLVQQLPAAFPRDNAKQLIDNERVTVWEATWPKGRPTAMHRFKYDAIAVELAANASVRITTRDGKSQSASLKFGQAAFIPKGTEEMEEGTSDSSRHAIVIELKDAVVPPLQNKSGYPDAFPREDSKKIVDNNRITVWDYTWTTGKPTPMHFHAKDVVTIYMATGEIRSTSLDGTIVVNAIEPGLAKYNPRNRTHTEELIKGEGRAIIVEMK
jgi:hypothetical protein